MTRVERPRLAAAWIPVVVWAALIFALSSIPGTRLPQIDLPHSDKGLHVLVYAILGALISRALDSNGGDSTGDRSGSGSGSGSDNENDGPRRQRQRQRQRRRTRLFIAVLLTTAYGITDEVHQFWTPNRSADWRDIIADACGGAAGALAIVAMRWMKIRG